MTGLIICTTLLLLCFLMAGVYEDSPILRVLAILLVGLGVVYLYKPIKLTLLTIL